MLSRLTLAYSCWLAVGATRLRIPSASAKCGWRSSRLLPTPGRLVSPFQSGRGQSGVQLRAQAESEEVAEDVAWDESLPPLNSVVLVGRVGTEPEAKEFENGSVVVNIPLAVRREYNGLERKARDIKYGEEETDWFQLEIWGSNAEYVRKYVTKGMRIGITGELSMDYWTDKESGEERGAAKIWVRSVEILQSRSEGSN